jgi:ATP-binding cassette subfamily B protein
VLKSVSFSVKQGEKLAFVGHNGAGKTTLVKLAMRLYDPTSGAILLNGIDIRQFDPAEYRALLGSVFQDFQIFAATLSENVVLDKIDPKDAGQQEAIAAALAKSGFSERLARMPRGLDSSLTREFDKEGENLSGGENQKVALSRVFVKESAMAFLDEPSSALDPDSEYELNKTMRDASRGSGVFFISHRLSSTLMADRILLLEDGRILEEGGHAELMALGGRYAEMFELQASRYRPPVEA